MKITLNIEKRYVYLIVGVLLAVLGFLVVYAYNSGGPASFVGHTWDEIVCDNNMCVDTNTGNVGIGTANPDSVLDINSIPRADITIPALTIRTYGISSGGSNSAIKFINSNTAQAWQIENAFDGSFRIGRPGDSTTGSYPLFITSSGEVGIGTTNPTQKLDVNGNVRVSGNLNSGSINTAQVNANQLCLGGSCITSWSQISSGGGGSVVCTEGQTATFTNGCIYVCRGGEWELLSCR